LTKILNKTNLALASLSFSVLFLLGGCASSGNLSIADESQQTVSTKIVQGKTTKAEISQIFGDPIKTSFTDSGNEIWEYDYNKTHAKAQNYIPLVSAFTHGSTGQKKTLTIFFDKNGIVKNYTMSASNIDTHEGIFQ